MKRFAAYRLRGALVPCDDDGREIVQALTPGRPVMVEVRQSRNIRQHRMLFALLRRVLDNLPIDQAAQFPTAEKLLDALKIQAGLTEHIVTVTGDTVEVPRSISFASMGQEEFGVFFGQCVEIVCEYVITELDADALLDEVMEMVA